jgi:hypothetical protein
MSTIHFQQTMALTPEQYIAGGLAPEGATYGSFATFRDPNGAHEQREGGQ